MNVTDNIFSLKNLSVSMVVKIGGKDKKVKNFSYYNGNAKFNRSSFLSISVNDPLISYENRTKEDSVSIWCSLFDFPELKETIEYMTEIMNNEEEILEETDGIDGEDKIIGIKEEYRKSVSVKIGTTSETRHVISFRPLLVINENKKYFLCINMYVDDKRFKVRFNSKNWKAFAFMINQTIDNFLPLSYSLASVFLSNSATSTYASKQYINSITEEDAEDE